VGFAGHHAVHKAVFDDLRDRKSPGGDRGHAVDAAWAPLTEGTAQDICPYFSNDGKSIVFHRKDERGQAVMRIDVATRAITRLVDVPTDDYVTLGDDAVAFVSPGGTATNKHKQGTLSRARFGDNPKPVILGRRKATTRGPVGA
jgi:hypothetical protein